jgi:hypothetical protein
MLAAIRAGFDQNQCERFLNGPLRREAAGGHHSAISVAAGRSSFTPTGRPVVLSRLRAGTFPPMGAAKDMLASRAINRAPLVSTGRWAALVCQFNDGASVVGFIGRNEIAHHRAISKRIAYRITPALDLAPKTDQVRKLRQSIKCVYPHFRNCGSKVVVLVCVAQWLSVSKIGPHRWVFDENLVDVLTPRNHLLVGTQRSTQARARIGLLQSVEANCYRTDTRN